MGSSSVAYCFRQYVGQVNHPCTRVHWSILSRRSVVLGCRAAYFSQWSIRERLMTTPRPDVSPSVEYSDFGNRIFANVERSGGWTMRNRSRTWKSKKTQGHFQLWRQILRKRGGGYSQAVPETNAPRLVTSSHFLCRNRRVTTKTHRSMSTRTLWYILCGA